MQTYILILLSVLVVLLIGVIYFGWRKLINLEIENSRNKYDIEALRNLLSKILESDDGGSLNAPLPNHPIMPLPMQNQSAQFNQANSLGRMQFMVPNVPPFPVKNPGNNRKPQKVFEQDESDIETLESTDNNLPKTKESTMSVEGLEESTFEEDDESSSESESEEETSETSNEEESEEDESNVEGSGVASSNEETTEENESDEELKIIESELELGGMEKKEEKKEEVREEKVNVVQVNDHKDVEEEIEQVEKEVAPRGVPVRRGRKSKK